MTAQQAAQIEPDNDTAIEQKLAAIANAEALLDRILEEAVGNHEQLRQTNNQMARIDEKMDRTFDYVKSIEGRVSQLEKWKLQVENAGAHQLATAAGRENVIRRSQLAIAAAAGGTIVAVAQIILEALA